MVGSAAKIDPEIQRLEDAGYQVARADLDGCAYVAGDGIVIVSTSPRAPALAAAALLRLRPDYIRPR